eukprot:1230795-Prymnesium_polylepis.1
MLRCKRHDTPPVTGWLRTAHRTVANAPDWTPLLAMMDLGVADRCRVRVSRRGVDLVDRTRSVQSRCHILVMTSSRLVSLA